MSYAGWRAGQRAERSRQVQQQVRRPHMRRVTIKRSMVEFTGAVRRRLRTDGRPAASTLWILAPMGDQSPLDQVERTLARLVVLPNDHQVLAWRSIVAGPDVAHATIADVEVFNNSEAKGLELWMIRPHMPLG
jgi:hypothetical protein